MTLFATATEARPFWLPDANSLVHLGPMWVLTGTLVALLLGSMVFGRGARTMAGIALAGAILAAGSCFGVLHRVVDGPWSGLAPGNRTPMLLADNFSLFFAVLECVFLAAVIGLYLFGQGAGAPRTDMHKNAPEFFTLLIGSALGMLLMVSTTNLLMIIIAIEMASLPSYVLAGFDKRSRPGAEASLKYVLFGGITSAIMIYGASLLYGYYKTLDVGQIAGQLSQGNANALSAVAFFCLAAGIGFKISAVPFHFWCPDVFEGAAIEVTTWLSVASKAAGLGLIIRILSVSAQAGLPAGFASHLAIGIGVFAAATCTVGNLAALAQTNIKRLLAYSSIAHAGYMLMAAAILVRADAHEAHPAFTALVVYLVVYMFMNLGAFSCAASVYWSTGKETLDAFTGLGRRSPFTALGMTVCLVSLVGLPPLGGFAAKYWLLANVWRADQQWLVVVAVLNTALSLYYYIKVIRQMWLADDGQPAMASSAGVVGLVSLSVVVILYTGTIGIGQLRGWCEDYTRQLYLGGEFVARPPAAAHAPTPVNSMKMDAR